MGTETSRTGHPDQPIMPMLRATSTAPTFQFYNVAISSAEKAVEAVRKKASASEDAAIRTVRSLLAAEVAAIPLRTGEAQLA